MWWVRFRKPEAVSRRCSRRPLSPLYVSSCRELTPCCGVDVSVYFAGEVALEAATDLMGVRPSVVRRST